MNSAPFSLSGGLFPATMWSAVGAAGGEGEEAKRAGLERLARAYWEPLYVFVRQRGSSHEDAADAVQGFFEQLVGKEMLQGVEPRETRFRTFLLRCFTNWLLSGRRKNLSEKRGGRICFVPLEEVDPELGGQRGGQGEESPEVVYDRQWARTVFARARERLSGEILTRERSDCLLEVQHRMFFPGEAGPDWAEVAGRFGLSEGAVRKAAFDLRAQFARMLRQEVAAGVGSHGEVDEELRYLFQLLSGPGPGK